MNFITTIQNQESSTVTALENSVDLLISSLNSCIAKVGLNQGTIANYESNGFYTDKDVYALANISELFYQQHEDNKDVYDAICEAEQNLKDAAEERETQGVWKTVAGVVLVGVGVACIIATAGAGAQKYTKMCIRDRCTCIIGAIWLLFVLICSKKGAETGNLIPTLIFTLVFIIAIYFSMNMANWRLIIEGKNITHINWRGKATHYNFENIKIKVCSNLTIKVYEGNRKVIVIDSNMKNLSSFMSWADAYKIPRI